MIKLNLKRKLFALLLAILLIGALWQAGKISLPPKLTYGIRFISYKLSQNGSIKSAATVKMDVKPHRQEHSLSCEVAALKMALAGVGVEVSEKELVQKLKYDKAPKQGKIWGDPQNGFVGNIDGQMPASGYGVYDQPIAELANQYRKAEILNEKTPQGLASELLAGRTVVVWGFFGRGRPLSWSTPGGREIKAVNGEHARTLIGFTGDAEGPRGFYLIDPIFGPLYWSTEQLTRNWNALDRMAVVVYPDESSVSVTNAN